MAVRDGYRWVNVFLCIFVPVEFPLSSTRVPDDISLGFSFSDVLVPFTIESRGRWWVEFGIIEMAVGIVESVDGYLGLVVDEGPRTIVDEGSVVKVVDSFTEFGVVGGLRESRLVAGIHYFYLLVPPIPKNRDPN